MRSKKIISPGSRNFNHYFPFVFHSESNSTVVLFKASNKQFPSVLLSGRRIIDNLFREITRSYGSRLEDFLLYREPNEEIQLNEYPYRIGTTEQSGPKDINMLSNRALSLLRGALYHPQKSMPVHDRSS